MCLPRKTLINLNNTKFYHCISRCVRRAFLCGKDALTNKDFSHRRQWYIKRLKLLAEHFAIGVCAYAVMSNHAHLVLKVQVEQAESWDELTVIEHWTAIFPSGLQQIKPYLLGEADELQTKTAKQIIQVWRKRLVDISWFMRALNQYISCRANKEDGCKGSFWESRFTSQALLDDTAVLSCMAYVDLNPVRAKAAQDLIDSDFTSIQERIVAFDKAKQQADKKAQTEHYNSTDFDAKTNQTSTLALQISDQPSQELGQRQDQQSHKSIFDSQAYQPDWLLAFGHSNNNTRLCFSLIDYFELVDWTGRQVRQDKKGHINEQIPTLLKQLNISQQQWLMLSQHFEQIFAGFAGSNEKLYFYANQHGKTYCKGLSW